MLISTRLRNRAASVEVNKRTSRMKKNVRHFDSRPSAPPGGRSPIHPANAPCRPAIKQKHFKPSKGRVMNLNKQVIEINKTKFCLSENTPSFPLDFWRWQCCTLFILFIPNVMFNYYKKFSELSHFCTLSVYLVLRIFCLVCTKTNSLSLALEISCVRHVSCTALSRVQGKPMKQL